MVVVPPPPLADVVAAPAVPPGPGATICELGELVPSGAQAARLSENDATSDRRKGEIFMLKPVRGYAAKCGVRKHYKGTNRSH